MSARTPGPWFRVKPLGARWWTLGRIEQHVARPLPEENEEADWRLAEAAPDLLTALEAVEHAPEVAQPDGRVAVYLDLAAVALINAALGKARGP